MRPNCFLFWLLWSLYPPSCAAQRKGNSGPLSISWNLRWMFKEIFSSFFLSFQKQKENKEARGSMFGGIRSRANWSKRQTKCSSAVVESSISGICKIRRKFPYSHFFLSLLYLTPFGREVRGVPFIDGISWNFFFPFSCKKKNSNNPVSIWRPAAATFSFMTTAITMIHRAAGIWKKGTRKKKESAKSEQILLHNPPGIRL